MWLVRRAAGVRVLRLRRAVLCATADAERRSAQQLHRSSSNPEAKADACSLMCNLAVCWLCDDGLMSSERERVREKTNMVPGECCNAACWDTCLATMFCWGCAAAQMKRELQVWFGHAGEGAPVHPGSPAAKRG